jgi:hypothetical protein
MKRIFSVLVVLSFAASILSLQAEGLPPEAQAKVDKALKDIQIWASDPVLVKAVKAQNAALPADHAAMTQDKWKAATILDPFVRSFSKNDAGTFLKTKKSDIISEAFVSDAQGLKVGFLAKTTGWSHKGNPKHEQPMSGKTWQGKVEVDESTGLQQVQISVPVVDEGKPIGSLVVGLVVSKL